MLESVLTQKKVRGEKLHMIATRKTRDKVKQRAGKSSVRRLYRGALDLLVRGKGK